jgi:hypothetical protein
MPAKRKITEPNDERFCTWCETKYHGRPDHTGPLCSDCRAELLEQSKEFLVEMLGHVASVNVISMAFLALNSPDLLDTMGMWNAPRREGFSQRLIAMREFVRKGQRVH